MLPLVPCLLLIEPSLVNKTFFLGNIYGGMSDVCNSCEAFIYRKIIISDILSNRVENGYLVVRRLRK